MQTIVVLGKVVIYLDQCAISELAINRNSCPQKARLRQILQEGHLKGLLVCPIPRETITEITGISSQKDRMLIYDLQCELADVGGPLVAFKSIYTMIAEESLALARDLPPPSSFDKIAWHSVEDDQLAAKQWEKFRKTKDLMKKRFARVNIPSLGASVSLQQARDEIVAEHVSHVFRQIERLEKGQGPARRDHMGYALALYLQREGVNRTELLRLKKAILSRKWEGIPVVWHRSLLAAQREAEYRSTIPRQYDVNDEIDLPRMAVALNAASVCITDRSMAALCNQVNRSMASMLKKAHVDGWTPKVVFAISETSKAADFIEAELARRALTKV